VDDVGARRAHHHVADPVIVLARADSFLARKSRRALTLINALDALNA
jgi:hypothetical protein